MTDSGWHYPGGGQAPGPYGPPPGSFPSGPPTPPPGSPPAGSPPPQPQSWGAAPGPGGPPPQGYGVPPPSGPPEKRWPIIALLGAVVLLVVAIVGVVVTSGSGDDDTATGTDGTGDDPDDPDPPSGDPFVDEEAGYGITLPDDWSYTSLNGEDRSGVGAEMFPDDDTKAGVIQTTVETLPRVITFYGVVGEEIGEPFFTNVNINSTSTPGVGDLPYDEFADQVGQGIDMVGATVTGDEPFTLAGADGVRIEFDYQPEIGASGVQYAAVIEDELWVVNFASADVPAYADEFDSIASSFELTG